MATWPQADQDRLHRRLQREWAKRTFRTPGQLAAYIERRTVQTPALELLDRYLVETTYGPETSRLIWTMPPQEGKSVRISRFYALWLLIQDPDRMIAVVSYADGLARRWGKAVRNDIRNHPEFGLLLSGDTSAANEWTLVDYDGGMICAGIAGGLTGRRADVIIIDDPLAGQKEADSEVYRENCKEWWRTTASSRLGGANTICVLVMTRWHEDDLAGWLVANNPDDWRLVNVPAQAEHDPDLQGGCKCNGLRGCLGSDVLGRKAGEFMVSARRRTHAGWEKRKRDAGTRGWYALYQGRPAPEDGNIFKRNWWRHAHWRCSPREDGTYFIPGVERVIQSWDMTFKDTDGSDFVVGQVWAFRGSTAYLIYQMRGRMEFPETCAAVEQLSALFPQALAKYIEDKANGPAVIAALRDRVSGIIPYTPVDSKVARARAASVFVEAGNVVLPNLGGDEALGQQPWVAGLIEEASAFPNATHDDQVDALSQALDIGLSHGWGGGDQFMRELHTALQPPAQAEERPPIPPPTWFRKVG